MTAEKVCKAVHQYSREPISKEDMDRLQEITDDYKKVKEYVYQMYSGQRSFSKVCMVCNLVYICYFICLFYFKILNLDI